MLPFLDNLINPNCWFGYVLLCTLSLIYPTVLVWMNSVVSLAMCEPAYFLFSLGNHAQLGGGSVAEILKRKLAYGWVERFSDIAGCGTSFLIR